MAPVPSIFRGQIEEHWTHSNCSNLSLVMSYSPSWTAQKGTFQCFFSADIKVGSSTREGLESAPQKLLGMSRKDSESRNMFRPKASGIDWPPWDSIEDDEASLVNSEKWAAFVLSFHEFPLTAAQKQGQIL